MILNVGAGGASKAESVKYDNSTSGLKSDDVQGAVDELKQSVKNLDSNKVSKVSGKGLSTNDYTTTEKEKLSGIATGANKTTVDSSLSTSSTNPVQNKVITTKVNALNSNMGKIKTYVGSDGKLHFTDASGADTALNFSSFKRFYNNSITFSSTEKTYEIGFKPKFFMIGVVSQNLIIWYDATLNKYFYNGFINNGANVGTTETVSSIFTLTQITNTGFSLKVNSGYNGKSGFILAFG